MVEEPIKEGSKKKETAAVPAAQKLKKKKSWPTNCAQSNKRIRRKDWYYRNGKYFANKKAFQLYVTQEAEKADKAKEAQALAKPATPAAPAAPAAQPSVASGEPKKG